MKQDYIDCFLILTYFVLKLGTRNVPLWGYELNPILGETENTGKSVSQWSSRIQMMSH